MTEIVIRDVDRIIEMVVRDGDRVIEHLQSYCAREALRRPLGFEPTLPVYEDVADQAVGVIPVQHHVPNPGLDVGRLPGESVQRFRVYGELDRWGGRRLREDRPDDTGAVHCLECGAEIRVKELPCPDEASPVE